MQNAMLAANMGQGAPMQGQMPEQGNEMVTVQIPMAMLPAFEQFMMQITGQQQGMSPQMPEQY